MKREQQIEVTVFLLRVVAGLLFIEHGGTKLFGWWGGSTASELSTLILVAGLLEFFGGLAVLLGVWVRPVAFVLAGLMAVAYFMAHSTVSTFYAPMNNGGELAVLYTFIFLFFAAYGGGRATLGSLISRK